MVTERHDLEPAFVVHRYPYRESSALVHCLTRNHGRIMLVARGCKRPRSALRHLLQPFVPLLVSWSTRGELGTLRDAERAGTLCAPSGAALLSGLYLNELVLRLTHRFDPHPGLFDAYAQALERLSSEPAIEDTLRHFEKRLLDEVGYGLLLERDCVRGEPVQPGARYRYVAQTGPVPDGGGAEAAGVAVHGATLLALARSAPMDASTRHEAKQLMRAEIDSHLGARPLATRRLFRSGASRA